MNSIAKRLIILLICVAAGVIFVLGIMEYHAGQLAIDNGLKQSMKIISNRLRTSLKESVNEFARATIRSTVKAEFPNSDLAAVLVWTQNRQRLLCGIQRKKNNLVDVHHGPKGKHIQSAMFKIYIIKQNTKLQIGEIDIFLNRRYPEKRLRIKLARSLGKLSITVFLLLTIMSFIISRYLVTPLESLRQAMTSTERAASGIEGPKAWEKLVNNLPTIASSSIFPELNKMASIYQNMLLTIIARHEELQLKEENLRTTLDSIGDAVIATDVTGKIIRLNPVAGKLTGWSCEEALGKHLSEIFHIIHAHNRKVVESPVTRVLSSGKIVGLANHTILISRDGTEYQIADSGAPIRSEKGDILGVVLVFRDITEEYVLQEQLRQSEKLQAIGQLAGGVAHDFNNMLGGIMGATELLMSQEKGLDKRSTKLIDMIMQATTRAADLTAKLLAFGRKGKLSSTAINCHTIIDDTVSILERAIDKKISILIKKDAKNYTIIGDNSSLQNSFMNIGINASHAMPEGGEIQIITSNISLDKHYCDTSTFELEPGDFIEIDIRDTGCGIPLENLHKIFEPFYTTRELGKGVGLGLSAVYGTIQKHHGAIIVYSEIGVGTSFQILLPCVKENITPKASNIEVISGSGQILLVDDEELIRITGKFMLEEMGYKVMLAKNGLEAIQIFQENNDEIDVVVMDMIMPEMNGREAFLKMKEININCKVIISSGFTKFESPEELEKLGLAGFLQKPFRYFELSKLLAKILQG